MMVEDQCIVLAELNRLAALKKVRLAIYLSLRSERSLTNLREKEGLEFDKKFISQMISDHKNELRLFRRASRFGDLEIKTFAQNNLSLIHSHLLLAQSLS